ncbi:MAG: SHOCT domain-containing protein [Pedobacter sp.]
MTHKGHITPGRLSIAQAKIGIVVAALFLLFGLAFGFVVLNETPDSEAGLKILMGGFFLLWVVVCIAMIIFYVRMLSKSINPEDQSLVDFQFEASGVADTSGRDNDFAGRLRHLEELKRDGLITEAEYRDKRAQIMAEKW